MLALVPGVAQNVPRVLGVGASYACYACLFYMFFCLPVLYGLHVSPASLCCAYGRSVCACHVCCAYTYVPGVVPAVPRVPGVVPAMLI